MELGLPTRTVLLSSPVCLRSSSLHEALALRRRAASPRLSSTPRIAADSPSVHLSAIFPGYYTGRATHVHIKVHTKWEPYQNGTFKTGGIVHTGQFFVEDHINEVIDKVSLLLRSMTRATEPAADTRLLHARSTHTPRTLSRTSGVALATGMTRSRSTRSRTRTGEPLLRGPFP